MLCMFSDDVINMGKEFPDYIKRSVIVDKFMFYIGFLETFTEKAKNVLKEDDIQHLKMLREYIIDARLLLKKE